jgi:hypothetical protein
MDGSAWGPFRLAAFRHAIAGRVISFAGAWIVTVAAGWVILDLTHSATTVGVLTACSRGPAIVLSTYGGTVAGRFRRRRLLAVPTRFLIAKRSISTADALSGPIVLAAASLLLLPISPNLTVAAVTMGLGGIGWDVFYILRLAGVQSADTQMSGLTKGLFLAATLGGVILGGVVVGGLFDVIGTGAGLTICAVLVAIVGLLTIRARRLGHTPRDVA